MSITGGIIIYVNLWMIIFFMVLPFGITNQIDSTDYQKGTDPGAPVESRIKKKILITTLKSIVIFSLILVVDQLDLFNIRKILF